MHDGGKLTQQDLGMERDAVKEASLIRIADINTLVLERRHFFIQIVCSLQVLE